MDGNKELSMDQLDNVNGGMGIVSIAAESTVEMVFGPFVYYKEDIDYPIY